MAVSALSRLALLLLAVLAVLAVFAPWYLVSDALTAAPVALAAPAAPSSLVFNYQGQLLDADGNPVCEGDAAGQTSFILDKIAAALEALDADIIERV